MRDPDIGIEQQENRAMARPTFARRIAAPALFAVLLLLPLAGCNSPPPTENFPALSWNQYPPYKLVGDHVNIVNGYAPSGQNGHLDLSTPRTMLESADGWAQARIQAAGGAGWITFVVTDASVVEAPLGVKTGLLHAFDNQADKRYDAHVAVRIEIHNVSGAIDGSVTAEASSSRTVAQDSDAREIQEAQYLVVQDAMLRLNQQLQTNIDAHLERFIVH
jgi:hypothetical protein